MMLWLAMRLSLSIDLAMIGMDRRQKQTQTPYHSPIPTLLQFKVLLFAAWKVF
jgi:hypothetical protein